MTRDSRRNQSAAPATARDGAAVAAADARRGRGARSNASGRFEPVSHVAFDDGWGGLEDIAPLRTTETAERPRRIIARNASPDIPFDRSINPYRGCEHGCVYCYARPTHAFHGLSPGLDFESRLFFKPDAAALLRAELARPSYRPAPIALGSNTDPYQPIERRREITRAVLEVLRECDHPATITTKSNLVLRDLDILRDMARRNLVNVALSITTLDRALARAMEPRAPTPARRLDAVRRLSEAGVPTAVMTAPLIPGLNDHEMEALLTAAAEAGAESADYTVLRLPLEIEGLMTEWLHDAYPARAAKVMSQMRALRGGRAYDADWGARMKGEGPAADLLAQRFRIATRRLGLNRRGWPALDSSRFRKPAADPRQLSLF